MSKQQHPHRAGIDDWIVFLVTGPEERLMAWQASAMFIVELFDRRAQTVRCRAHGDAEDRGRRAYERACDLAKRFDVTVQDLCERATSGDDYPVVHLGSHGMKWPDYVVGEPSAE